MLVAAPWLILATVAMEGFAALPRTQVARVLERHLGGDVDARARGLLAEETELLETWTPYGPLLKNVSVPHRLHGEVSFRAIDPRALVWLELRLAPDFAVFLNQSLEGGRSPLTLYMDDVRPGNALRPDSGRLFYAFYWTVVAMPHWWRTSEWGWWDLCFIMHSTLLTILGGMFGSLHHLSLYLDSWDLSRIEGEPKSYEGLDLERNRRLDLERNRRLGLERNRIKARPEQSFF